jgi:hypothetical protein
MNFTIYLSVLCPEEERAVPDLPAFYRHPVIDAEDMREIFKRNIPPVLSCAVIEPDAYMLQDIPAALPDPRNDIFDDALLPPSPLFATLTALLAVLTGRHGHSPSGSDAGAQFRHFLWILLCMLTLFCRGVGRPVLDLS